MESPRRPEPASPPWQPGTRLALGILLLILTLLLLSRLRQLLVPVVLAVLLAYLLHPLVSRLSQRLRISRGLSVLIVYGVVGLLLAGITAGLGLAISQQVSGLVADLGQISTAIPSLLERLTTLRLTFGPWVIDLATINLDPILGSLSSALRPLISGTGTMVASAAGATASVVGILLAVMVLGYYMLLDFGTIDDGLLAMVPPAHQKDIRRLLDETGQVWHAFLRGQFILAMVIGTVVAAALGVLGVRFALVLGLIAGLLEFVPIFGPALSGLIAVLVALFQGSNWWGLPPVWFGVVVLVAFVLIQQVENNILVPRIIGLSLNLHPLLVLLGAFAGGALGGVIGLLLAAPMVATLRLWIGYVYRKVVGLETWPQPVLGPPKRRRRESLWQRLRARRLGRRSRPSGGEGRGG
jgi:predicted PurR-regulated permease PerM